MHLALVGESIGLLSPKGGLDVRVPLLRHSHLVLHRLDLLRLLLLLLLQDHGLLLGRHGRSREGRRGGRPGITSHTLTLRRGVAAGRLRCLHGRRGSLIRRSSTIRPDNQH